MAAFDIQSIFSCSDSDERDYLVRNNSHRVKIESLKGKKIVGLYFSAYWCPPCRKFTPTLKELYNKINNNNNGVSAKGGGGDLEIVYVSADKDEEGFNAYFQKMPWLAVPFSDSQTRNRLNEVFNVRGIPQLIILDEDAKVVTQDGTSVVLEYGAVQPQDFTTEWIREVKEQEDEAKKNQSLRSVLVYKSRDFLVSSDGNQVPVSELEGKTVGLYFTSLTYRERDCAEFTPKLVELYENLKSKGDNFEIVSISVDEDEEDEESFKQRRLRTVPWLSLPHKEKTNVKLTRYFELTTLPTLVIIGPDGKTLHSNVVDAIEEHGVASYPFTPQKLAELSQKPKESTNQGEGKKEEEEDDGGVCDDGHVCYKA